MLSVDEPVVVGVNHSPKLKMAGRPIGQPSGQSPIFFR